MAMGSALDAEPAAVVPPAKARRQLAATAGSWVLVVVGMAAVLRVADALPGAALDLPRGVRRPGALADLERLAGRRMLLPSYYPDTIDWPPFERRYDGAGSAAIWCRQRVTGASWLVVATAPSSRGGIAAQVLPECTELQREDGAIHGRPAILARVRGNDGAVWQQVQWRSAREIVLVRYRGTLEELMKIAGSVHE